MFPLPHSSIKPPKPTTSSLLEKDKGSRNMGNTIASKFPSLESHNQLVSPSVPTWRYIGLSFIVTGSKYWNSLPEDAPWEHLHPHRTQTVQEDAPSPP